MLGKNIVKLTTYSPISAMIFAGGISLSSGGQAQALTAADVLNVMEEAEQRGFIAGAVGGLAFSRYLRDKPDQTGMNCIYDWYYDGGAENDRKIIQWFERHPDKSPEPLLYVLIKRVCGE